MASTDDVNGAILSGVQLGVTIGVAGMALNTFDRISKSFNEPLDKYKKHSVSSKLVHHSKGFI